MKWTTYVKIAAGYIALYILYDYLFAKFLPHARVWYKIAGAALLMMLPAAVFYGLRFSIGEVLLIRRSHHPRLVDGKRVAVLGSLRPFAEPIQTPFSKQDCLAYSYSVYSWKTDPKSKQRLQIFAYSGQAMTRSVIRSTAGDLKLLSFVDGTESKEYQGSDLEVRQ